MFRLATTFSLSRLFGAACLPTVQVEQGALIAFPGEFLGSDRHVFGEGTIRAVVVFLNGSVLGHHEEASRTTDKDGNLDPQPQLGPFFVEGFVGVCRRELLLVGDSCPNLFDGLGLHLGFGTDLWNGLDRTELRGACCCGCGTATNRQGASEASGCYQRLCFCFVCACACVRSDVVNSSANGFAFVSSQNR